MSERFSAGSFSAETTAGTPFRAGTRGVGTRGDEPSISAPSPSAERLHPGAAPENRCACLRHGLSCPAYPSLSKASPPVAHAYAVRPAPCHQHPVRQPTARMPLRPAAPVFSFPVEPSSEMTGRMFHGKHFETTPHYPKEREKQHSRRHPLPRRYGYAPCLPPIRIASAMRSSFSSARSRPPRICEVRSRQSSRGT